eukprot:COSAG01_NODE_216_length_21695_cov_83.368772_22_plen_65_part_00
MINAVSGNYDYKNRKKKKDVLSEEEVEDVFSSSELDSSELSVAGMPVNPYAMDYLNIKNIELDE